MGCLFASGVAGLIYEVCWIRRAALVFGSTSLALSSVVAVFFLGLAAGSHYFGRLSVRTATPLRWFALLEITLAILALSSIVTFDVAEELYGALYRALPETSVAHWMLRIALVVLVLLPPTFLMGGTLPLFCAQFVTLRSRITESVGFLYALNTLGAALGCALAGFILIPFVGVKGSIGLAALLNTAAGAVAGFLGLRVETAATEAVPGRRTSAWGGALVPALFFVTGFVAIGQQVLWTRYLGLVVRNTVHTYTLTLTTILVGIVVGSWVASRSKHSTRDLGSIFGGIQMLFAVSVVALMMLPPGAWRYVGRELWMHLALMLTPAVLSGAGFPVAVRLVVDDPRLVGLGVGRMAAVNTAGGILGSLAVGFVALPLLGLHSSVLFNTGLSLVAGCTAWHVLARRRFGFRSIGVTGLAVLAWYAVPAALGTRIPEDFLASPATLVESREGLESNLAVVDEDGDLRLEIDRWWQGQARKNHQVVAAHLPMLMHENPHSVLVVGAGAGQTPQRFLLYDIDRLHCVDIEPAVFDLIRTHFAADWMDDPRVRLIAADGRSYVAHTASTYDVISLELGQIFRPGVASFYTADFYSKARDRLEPDGILAQFVPITLLSRRDFRSLVRTFIEVFPASSIWYNTSELLLVGRKSERLDLAGMRLEWLTSNPQIHEDLRYSHWGGPSYALNQSRNFLACFLVGPAGLAAMAADAPILTDDRPVLEYRAAHVDPTRANELPILALLRDHLESIAGFSLIPATLEAIHVVRDKNLDDIEASAMIRHALLARDTGNYERVTALLDDALRANPESVAATRLMGDVLVLRGHLEPARLRYRRALSMRQSDVQSLRGLAFVLHRQGRVSQALELYRQVLEQAPRDAEAHNNLGTILGQAGDLEGAQAHFEAALRIRPGYADASKNLARVRGATNTGGL